MGISISLFTVLPLLFSSVADASDEAVGTRVFSTAELSQIYLDARSPKDTKKVYDARVILGRLYKYGNSSAGISIDESTSQVWLRAANEMQSSKVDSEVAHGHAIHVGGSCSFFGETIPDSVFPFSSDPEAERMIEEIVEVTGLPKNFDIRAAGVPNAAATVIGGERVILYNQNFIREIRNKVNNHWASYSVLAHEVGHHLAGHTLKNSGSRPRLELEADKYSGFVLQRLGASLDDAQILMNTIGQHTGNATHPARNDRLAAIANGWIAECDRDPRCGDSENSGGNLTANKKTTVPLILSEQKFVNDWTFEVGKFCAYEYTLNKYAKECEVAEKAVLLKAKEIYETNSACIKHREQSEELLNATTDATRNYNIKWRKHYGDNCRKYIQRYAYSAEKSALTQLANSNQELFREGSQFLAFGFLPGHEEDPKVVKRFSIAE